MSCSVLRRRGALRALFLLVAVLVAAPPASADASVDAKVKAVFIYKITRYVEWPSGALPDTLLIGVLGEHPVAGMLSELAAANGHERPVNVVRFTGVEDVRPCHILFVSADVPDPRPYLDHDSCRQTLIVGETEDFTSRGGMVSLRSGSDRVGLDINLRTARRAGIKLSSKLLRLARVTR